jgi:3'-5' exoribonuclease
VITGFGIKRVKNPKQTRERINVSQILPGELIETGLLVLEKRLQNTRAGGSFLALKLGDATGSINGRIWDDVIAYDGLFEAGDIIAVEALAETYKSVLQLKIKRLRLIPEAECDLSLFYPASQYDTEEMFNGLCKLIAEEIEDERVSRLLLSLLRDPEISGRFCRVPAAKVNHHAYLGGLLEHTLSMSKIAAQLGDHYRQYYPGLLNRDLLIAGAVLHDLGKIYELLDSQGFNYTTEGRLLGHIIIGLQLVEDAAKRLGIEDKELMLQLKHLIASHHGELDFGAVVQPQTAEAQILHYIDQIDSRLNMFSGAIENTSGEWSEYVRPLGRALYKGKISSSQTNREEETPDSPSADVDREQQEEKDPEKTFNLDLF